MEILRELMRKPKSADTLAISLFVLATLYTIVRGTTHTIFAGIAFVLIVMGALPKQMALAFLVGASVIVLLQTRRREGFESGGSSGVGAEEQEEGAEKEEEEEEGEEKEKKEEKEEKGEGFASKRVMLPDHTTRKEPLVLGQEYRLPSESDDKGYHLDAGTTFLNAYKALKPDQIAAMTKDTQELLATQRSLVTMLDSFTPLLKDMNKITGFFGPGKQ
jgi:hypothetical protein